MKTFNEFEVIMKVNIILGGSQVPDTYGKILHTSLENMLKSYHTPYENIGVSLIKIVDKDETT